jgi:SSS family solute:Na+ symporter
MGAGTGGVLLLRWYWWRINAWSEISSMTAAFIVSMSLQRVHFSGNTSVIFAKSTMITTLITTVVWLVTTLLTAPETDERLVKFYRRVQPTVHGWKRIAALAPEIPPVRDFAANTFDWLMGCVLVYCAMFGIGELILQAWVAGLLLFACAAVAGYLIYWSLARRGWETLSGRVDTPLDGGESEIVAPTGD